MEKNKHINKYSIIALVILVIYLIGLMYYLSETHRQIKDVYIDIGNKQSENNFLKSELLRIKIERKLFFSSIDLETDNSIHKFVTSNKSLNNKLYTPANLEKIGSEYIYDMKGDVLLLTKESNKALQEMGKVFFEEFNKKISVLSAYRSYFYQKTIKDGGCSDTLCSKPGYSEHQLGLSLDLWEATTDEQFLSDPVLKTYFDWLNKNAHFYGFHNTYSKGLEIDGYEIEPWHWRYLGEELAIYLKDNNLTIAEFYNKYGD